MISVGQEPTEAGEENQTGRKSSPFDSREL